MTLFSLGLKSSAIAALHRKGILAVADLAFVEKEEIEKLSGIGPKSMQVLCDEMKKQNMDFKKEK